MAIRRLMIMGLTNYIRSLINSFKIAATNQVQFEAENCLYADLDELNKIDLLGDAYTVLTPNTFAEREVAGLYPAITNIPIVNQLSYTNLFNVLWTNSLTTTTRVNVTNPFGGIYSNQIAETASTNVHNVNQPFIAIVGVTYTFSVYLKKGIGATSPDIMQLTFGTNGFNSTLYANFNINTGVVTSSSGVTPTISNAGNGWWRCSMSVAASSTNTNSAVVIAFTNNNASAARSPSYLGVTTASTYVYGAQLEVGSSPTLYQEIDIVSPNANNYASVSKGSSLYTFRTKQDGLLETAPWNLASYSEDMALFTLSNVTTEPYAALSPIGTLTATRVIETSSNTTHALNSAVITLREAIPLRCSIYMKKGVGSSAPDWMQLTIFAGGVAGSQRANFNINTGSIGSFSPGSNPSITDAGNGWWLCEATFIPLTLTTATSIFVCFINNSGTSARLPAYAGSTNSDIYLWGAQMVEGNISYPYLSTTNRQNFPRLNYSDYPNVVNSCPHYLLESTVTNLFLNSEVFSSIWVTSNITVTPDTEISPQGLYNADTLTATSNDAYITQSGGASSTNATRIFSVWLKRKTGSGTISMQSGDAAINVNINNSTWTRCWVYNNSISGTYTSSGTAYTVNTSTPHGLITGDAIRLQVISGTAGSQNITSITVTSATQFTFTGTNITTSGNCNVISNSGRIIFSTSGDEVYAWGAQLETVVTNVSSNANIIPSSYISTGNTTITRSADTMTALNPGTAQATFYARMKRIGGTNSNTTPFIGLLDSPTVSTSVNAIVCSGVTGGTILWYYRTGGGAVTSLATNTTYSPPENDYFDVLITVDNSATYKFNIWMDGSLIVSSTIAIDVSTLKYVVFGGGQPFLFVDKYIAWDRVLTNDEITSLFSYPYYNAGYAPTNVELQHVINRAYAEGFTLPSPSTLSFCDSLITSMKSDGTWALSDVFFNFAYNDTSLSNFSRINWKNPYGALGLATVYGGITYLTDGFKGDGSSAYIDTMYNPSVIRSNANYTLNNAGRISVIANAGTISGTNAFLEGVIGSAVNALRLANTAGHYINQGTTALSPGANMTGSGLKSIMRDSSTNVRLQNGATITNSVATSTAIPNATQVLFRGSAFWVDATMSSYYMGGSLSNTQISNFRTYYNQYLVNIGLTAFA